MTIGELKRALDRFSITDDRPVVIYNDGDFDIEEAWLDRSSNRFAIQVVPSPELLTKEGENT